MEERGERSWFGWGVRDIKSGGRAVPGDRSAEAGKCSVPEA